jgi:hypothetical protein
MLTGRLDNQFHPLRRQLGSATDCSAPPRLYCPCR